MSPKQRIDVILVERGVFPTREKARAALMTGVVYVDGQKVDKPGTMINDDKPIIVREGACPFVSRGGLKLAKAIEYFDLDLRDKVVLDVGASTGGFTDCALKNGAAKVFAVDVGYGQLAWVLRQDPRVVNLERTNFRHIQYEQIGQAVDVVTIDVAFISLEMIFPALKQFLHSDSRVVALIKPQFEAGRENVGKKGVVKDPAIHLQVIRKVFAAASAQGLNPLGLTFSPVKGPEGNIEYLFLVGSDTCTAERTVESFEATVAAAHQSFRVQED